MTNMFRNGLMANTHEEEGLRALMEVNNQEQYQNELQLTHQNGGGNGLYMKVMTDEQMEVLRKQIAAYAVISEQLVEMHKAMTAQQDMAGSSLGNLYSDSLMTYGGNKITSRQRWTPTPAQLQMLERFFDEGNGTPSKQKIKDMTSELSQHGQISETNVYNWFQNRRARSKRKQSVAPQNNAESEVEAESESSKEIKVKPDESANAPENMTLADHHAQFQDPKSHCFGVQSDNGKLHFQSDNGLRSYGSFN